MKTQSLPAIGKMKARSILFPGLVALALLGVEDASHAVIPRWLFTNAPPKSIIKASTLRKTALAADESLEIGLILLNPGRAGEEGEKTYFLSVLLHVDISAPIAGADARDRNVEGRVVPLAPPQLITKSKGRWLLPLNEVFQVSAQEIAERISRLVAPREEASASALELRYWTRPWTAEQPLGRTLILMKTIRSDAERTNHTSLLLKDSPGTYPGQPPYEPTYSALSGYVRISRSETYIANEMAAPTPPPPNLTNLNAVVVSPSRSELLGSDQ